MKSPLFTLCLVALSFISNAQVTLTPKIGFSLSNVTMSDDVSFTMGDYRNRLGLTAGVAAEFSFGQSFALQPEFLFTQKGWVEKSTFTGITSTSKVTINYLEVPVLARVKFGKFYVNAGPSVAIGFGGRHKITVSDGGFSGNATGRVWFGQEDEDNDYYSGDMYFDNRFNFSAQVGGGFTIPRIITIDVRYGFGLSNLYDRSDVDDTSKLRSLQVTVGYPIKLGKK